MNRPLNIALFLALSFLSRDAFALGPVDVEIAAKAGYGANPVSSELVNPLGPGMGVRAGVVASGFYAGVNIVDYLSADASGSFVSEHALLYGVEAGYGFKLLDVLTLRPQLGAGNMTITSTFAVDESVVSAGGGALSSSESNLYLEPGVTALVAVGTGGFVGADVTLLVVPGIDLFGKSTWTTPTFHLELGIKF